MGPRVEQLAAGQEVLERLAAAYVARLFTTAGYESGDTLTLAELTVRLAVAPSYARLLQRLVAIAAAAGGISPQGRVAPQLGALAAEVQSLAAQLAQWPELESAAGLLTRCGERLAEVLSQREDPVGLLFPDGQLALAQGVYEETPAARGFARLIAAALGQLAASGRGPLRVIEVGAGTGATTAALLAVLPSEATYQFTDLSAGFLNLAEARFAGDGRLDYRVLDIERSPAAQGFTEGRYDVVVATNVLHATRTLDETLSHVRELLAPGGWLLLTETTRAWNWVELTFGLTDGWWRFTDLREAGPLLSVAGWQRALEQAGFSPAEAFPRAAADQHLLVAQATAPLLDGSTASAPTPAFRAWVHQLLAGQLRLSIDQLDPAANFMDLGFDSILALQIRRALSDALGIELEPTLLFRESSVAALADYLQTHHPETIQRLLPRR